MKNSLVYALFLAMSLHANAPTTVGDASGRSHVLRGNGYSLARPVAWEVDNTHVYGTDIVLLAPMEMAEDQFRENVSVVVQVLPGDSITLDAFVQRSLQQIVGIALNRKVLSSQRTQCAGIECHRVIFDHSQGTVQLRREQYYFVRNGKAYIITYSAESASIFKFQREAISIVKSFLPD